MVQEQIFSIEKRQLEDLVGHLSADNLDDILPEMKRHIHMLESMQACSYAGQEPDKVEELYRVGRMSRGLRGGFIGVRGADAIFIPENVVRVMGFEHGDKIEAERLPNKKYAKHFKYTLVEKGDGCMEEEEPVCAEQLEVRHDVMMNRRFVYVPVGTTSAKIRIALSEADVQKFDIRPGDVIDYAYVVDDVRHGMVRWKYAKSSDTVKSAV